MWAGQESEGCWATTQTSEPGARWWPHCVLSGAARAPRTPKAQTHFFPLLQPPSPATVPRNSTGQGRGQTPFLEPTHLGEGSLGQFRLPLLIQLIQISNTD